MTRTALLALALVGCRRPPVTFSDSVDLELNFGFSPDEDAGLHTPYVQGARMSLSIVARHHEDMSRWTVRSEDESVFLLEGIEADEDSLYVEAAALSPGESTLIVTDPDGEDVADTVIEVGRPDHVELLAHGPLLIDRPDLADDGTPMVLVDGTSTWLAQYWRGGEQLFGNGTLEVEGSGSFDAWTEDTFLFEDRDWLQGSAMSTGNHSVDLYVGGELIETVTVEAVGDEAVDWVGIYGEEEKHTEDGDEITVIAQAWSAGDRPIYGVDFDWDLDGVVEELEGDLYRYEYNEDQEHDLTASFDGLGDTIQIHGEGEVGSTNHLGCATAKGRLGAALVGLAALLGLRRRRGVR